MHHLIYDENFPQNVWSKYCCFSLVTDEETELRKKLRGKEQAAPGEWTALGFDSRHLMSARSSHSVSLVLISVPKITDGRADWTAYLMFSLRGLKKEGLTLSILYLLLGFQPFDVTQCHVAWPGSQPAHPPDLQLCVPFSESHTSTGIRKRVYQIHLEQRAFHTDVESCSKICLIKFTCD